MASRTKHRTATNPVDSATLTINERILKECHNLYTDPEKEPVELRTPKEDRKLRRKVSSILQVLKEGNSHYPNKHTKSDLREIRLVKIASGLGLKLLAPRKKINVLLIGNHSAGKSTFINWYIEEHIQKVGVAIETQGFTIVTSGKKRETLTGNATLHLYPHFAPLQSINGLVDYLTTEISTSKQKKFSLVTFIDTPGLVDGDMKYPFDVNEAIMFLGKMADMIFVFFDPIGQALCKRTLNLVEKLNAKYSDRIRMYLSKADEAGHESDRQKVLMQVVQELCKRPGLNKCGFDLPTIYVPKPNTVNRCANRIEEVCKDIDRTINLTIQNTLNTLEYDCEQISNAICDAIYNDDHCSRENFRASGKGILLGLLGAFLPLLSLLCFLANNISEEVLKFFLGKSGTAFLQYYMSHLLGFWNRLPSSYHLTALVIITVTSIILFVLAKWYSRLRPTLTRKQKRALLETRDYVQNYIKVKKQHLYQEYLKQCAAEHDLH